MDPLEYLFRERQQRYEAFGNIADRLREIGEERRRKEFTQALMGAIPEDRPIDYDVIVKLSNQFPNKDPLDIFNAASGLAKIRESERVKGILNTMHSFETRRLAAKDDNEKATIAREANQFKATTQTNDPTGWASAIQIYNESKPQLIQRDPDKATYRTDWTGNETLYTPARKKEDTDLSPERLRLNQLIEDAGGDSRIGLRWFGIEKQYPIGKSITKKQRDESGEVREIQKTVTGYDPKTHAPVFDETDITEDYLQKKQYRDYVASQRARGVAEKDIPAFDEFLIMMKSVTDRIMMGGYGGGGGSAPSAPSPTTKTWNPTKGAFE